MKRIDFIYFDAGGGHRAAATALKAMIERQGRPWNVRLVHLQEVLDPLDIFRKLTGLRLQDIYNRALERGWTLGSGGLTRLMQLVIRAYHGPQVRLLERFWKDDPPDMVVSLVPNFNRALREAYSRARPGAPFVTVLTDLADFPPHFWIERQEQYLICGSRRAADQARELGHPPERVFRVSGMILRPEFYEPLQINRAAERRRIGLDPELPTGLVMFGGRGSRAMNTIVGRLDDSALQLQLILICGRNPKLTAELSRTPCRFPLFIEGFTDRIRYYMALSDFFIGKPGPGSMSEAFQMKLPVIVDANAWTLPQERYNAEWLLDRQAGLVVRNFREIAGAVEQLLVSATFSRLRAGAARSRTAAVFEIPDILERISETGPVALKEFHV